MKNEAIGKNFDDMYGSAIAYYASNKVHEVIYPSSLNSNIEIVSEMFRSATNNIIIADTDLSSKVLCSTECISALEKFLENESCSVDILLEQEPDTECGFFKFISRADIFYKVSIRGGGGKRFTTIDQKTKEKCDLRFIVADGGMYYMQTVGASVKAQADFNDIGFADILKSQFTRNYSNEKIIKTHIDVQSRIIENAVGDIRQGNGRRDVFVSLSKETTGNVSAKTLDEWWKLLNEKYPKYNFIFLPSDCEETKYEIR